MKIYLSILIGFVICGCSSLQMASSSRRSVAGEPVDSLAKIYIEPAPIFDFECQQKTKFKIEPAVQKEFAEKSVNFQKEWDKQSENLVRFSELGAGRKFPRRDYSVALTLCYWTPMGHPLIVAAGPYLIGTNKNSKPTMSMIAFVSMTHHELLHSLVDNIINQEFSNKSAMLEKYNTENYNVLVHLHLMAIQKFTYDKMKNKDFITNTDELYAFIGGDYKRAWDIINLEGSSRFIEELRAFNSKP